MIAGTEPHKRPCLGDVQEACLVRFDNLDATLAKIDGRLDRLEVSLLIGNGKPSLVSRVATIESRHASEDEGGSSRRSNVWAGLIALVSAIIGALVTGWVT